MGCPRSRGQAEISRLGLEDFDQGDEVCLAGVPPTYILGDSANAGTDDLRRVPRIMMGRGLQPSQPGTPQGYVGHLYLLSPPPIVLRGRGPPVATRL